MVAHPSIEWRRLEDHVWTSVGYTVTSRPSLSYSMTLSPKKQDRGHSSAGRVLRAWVLPSTSQTGMREGSKVMRSSRASSARVSLRPGDNLKKIQKIKLGSEDHPCT